MERLTGTDLLQLLAVSESAGWLHTDEDWRAVLRAGAVFGHRVDGNEIVSTSAIFSYGPGLTSVGMVIVKPAWRGRGLAKALMLHALAFARTPAVILIATDYGFPLYQRLGFKTVAHVRRVMAPAMRQSPTTAAHGLELAPARDSDVAAIRELDRAVIGADRASMLDARRAYARGASVLRGANGTIVGFALATPQRGTLVVGPVIAPDPDAAAALIARVAADHAGPVRVDVPTEQTQLTALLAVAGFEAAAEMAPLMIYGGGALAGDRRRLFGIANRGFC
jgi:predicted N-acetyltransferase YhbS